MALAGLLTERYPGAGAIVEAILFYSLVASLGLGLGWGWYGWL